MAIILGVSHMLIGICLKAANSLYFGRMIDFFFEFIPQFVMMIVLFGYMSVLIIVKWLTFWKNTNQAPSIIAFMINIFLKKGEIMGQPLIGSKQFNEKLNITFLIIALLCIPLMLLVKPLYLKLTDHSYLEIKPGKPNP